MNTKEINVTKEVFCEIDPNGKDLMIDLETMGSPPFAPILEIAAVGFNKENPSDIGPIFYRSFNLKDVVDRGYKMCPDTHEWWMEQERYKKVVAGSHDFVLSLKELDAFMNPFERVWTKSPVFDCALLRYAYKKEEIDDRWGFKKRRSFRDVRTAADRNKHWEISSVGLDKWNYQNNHHPIADCLLQISQVYESGFFPLANVNDLRTIEEPVSHEAIKAWGNDFYHFEQIL